MLTELRNKTKTKVDPNLTEKYKGKILFKEKYDWAVNHVKGRDIEKEILDALNKEIITKP
ncbi:MAG TPA: hypothetical protein PKD16_14950 [Saprospiraceae bacterium]|jgi:Na+-transporting NADH:ubiquinone oxidoreductase subunit NqrC|nr:hypothetical protein [Saprospiraceae bacterium]HMT71463.1 hypothetical protein [Saprospiraceae bacterium]